jgi:polysaccharide export outer membrane protein
MDGRSRTAYAGLAVFFSVLVAVGEDASAAERVATWRASHPYVVRLPSLSSQEPWGGPLGSSLTRLPATSNEASGDLAGWAPAEYPTTTPALGSPLSARRSNACPLSAVVSPRIEAVASQADRLVDHGFDLARRRACFAARAEFVAALQMIALALDAEDGGNRFSNALVDGLTALEEADDFTATGSRLSVTVDLEAIVGRHPTPILKERSLHDIAPVAARQRYCDYAQHALARAAGGVPAASRALLALGRIYSILDIDTARPYSTNVAKTLVAYRAALEADPRNHLAANELGVLQAQLGLWEEARTTLQHSAAVCALSETWHNLSVVHAKLGDIDLAQAARERAEAMSAQQPAVASNVLVSWTASDRLARSDRSVGWDSVPTPGVQPPLPDRAVVTGANTWNPTNSAPPHAAAPANFAAIPEWHEPGEYIGPARTAHVPQYRLRVDDSLEFVYRLTREQLSAPYRLNVGDVLVIESLTDPSINRGGIAAGRGLVIQPDGTIVLPMIGQIRAANQTVAELTEALTQRYQKFVRDPQITVTPLQVNTKLEDLRAAVDSRYGAGGQSRRARLAPEGTVQLPGIGSVPAQGLTLDELKYEIDERYAQITQGIEVTPILTERAPRYVFVLGEVRSPGRFTLEGPTTLLQALALAGGWSFTGDTRQVVVFRRTEDWGVIATRVDIRQTLLGKTCCPAGEIWLRDSDVVIVPKTHVQLANEFIFQVFTRGLYGVLPLSVGWDLGQASTL